ncbi:transposase [Synoicihabitans lomoniglobus]|uniref:Transposase n=1 Tax=Synoicihabitans lomoniglobus TaxID=2909285 RepID=A0AAE9ZXP1_9BACT|nr:transposase [Opitutaceae bacterium LMO-M01]
MRRNRVSISGATYFLTLCTNHRNRGLNTPTIAASIRAETGAIEHDRHWHVRGAVIMPDHLHLLAVITGSRSLSRTVARLKSKTRCELAAAGLSWKSNYFDHRLRPDDHVSAALSYLVMNPVRGGLVAATKDYPHVWIGPEETTWFAWPPADDALARPHWLDRG